MTLRILRLGTPRLENEGVRIGTVRRPPRGVPKTRFSSENWYDVWFPTLAPSVETMKIALGAKTPGDWDKFARKFRAEMASPESAHAIELLAILSHTADFSVGCYCKDESRCHRSLLRELFTAKGAKLEG